MINLANDTIDLYKIRKGEFNMKEHEFKPYELNQKLTKLFKFSLKQKEINWNFEFDPTFENLTFTGDSDRIL